MHSGSYFGGDLQGHFRTCNPIRNPNRRPGEPVARFIVNSGHLNKSRTKIKRHAFEPAPATRTTSVFRIHSLDEPEVWAIGRAHVADPQGKKLHGRADLAIEAVTSLGLAVVPTDPPPRHAEISGWPLEKSAVMSLAQELASRASLKLNS